MTITDINLFPDVPGNTLEEAISVFSVDENRYAAIFSARTSFNPFTLRVQLLGTDGGGFNFAHFSDSPQGFTRFLFRTCMSNIKGL